MLMQILAVSLEQVAAREQVPITEGSFEWLETRAQQELGIYFATHSGSQASPTPRPALGTPRIVGSCF